MKTEGIPVQVKESIHILEENRKSCERMQKALSVPKSTVWSILQKKEALVNIERKTYMVDDHKMKIFFSFSLI